MKKLLLLVVLFTGKVFAQNNIIPAPVSYQNSGSMFMLDNRVSIDVRTENAEVQQIAKLFACVISKNNTSLPFKKVETPSSTDKSIVFILNQTPDAKLKDEGYELEVTENSIRLQANKPAGLFNATQTLRQLFPAEMEAKDNMSMGFGIVTGCKITDYPRFAWRGLMLDVSRHFYTKNEVKEYIDMMARYKFNTLHWHLTDDNGWRIEIKSLPKLTEVGAWRVQRYGRFNDRENPKEGEPATYGGFYTQDEIKEIVKFAQDRNVTIVPEVDVPGHSMAALAAYPELACDKAKKYVNPGTAFSEWFADGTFKMLIDNTLNPSDENVYGFLDKVFTEVAALFPNKYIHVGGDECYHGYWEQDPNCQALMKKKNLKDGHELQAYFMKRVAEIVAKKGKKMIGWDEILEGGLADGAAVMSWRGMKGGIEAAKQGHDVVMSPTTFAYLDYTQGDPSVEFPIYASLSLKKTYQFEPVPDGVDEKYILGGQANLWTEQIPTIRHAFYMTYPRAFATSESVWSPKESKNWDSFVGRVESHFHRFDVAEQSICKAIYDPIVKTKKDGDKLLCDLSSDIQGVELYYTTDNTFPDKYTPKFSSTFEIPTGDVTLKVAAYRNGRPIGRVLSIKRDDLIKRAGK